MPTVQLAAYSSLQYVTPLVSHTDVIACDNLMHKDNSTQLIVVHIRRCLHLYVCIKISANYE